MLLLPIGLIVLLKMYQLNNTLIMVLINFAEIARDLYKAIMMDVEAPKLREEFNRIFQNGWQVNK